MGRAARGVRAMDLAEGDYLVGAEVVRPGDLILSISELGFGKRTPVEDYRRTARGAKGVINMKVTQRTGGVAAVLAVRSFAWRRPRSARPAARRKGCAWCAWKATIAWRPPR